MLIKTRRLSFLLLFSLSCHANALSTNVDACDAIQCRQIENITLDDLKTGTLTVFQSSKGSHQLLEKLKTPLSFSTKPNDWLWFHITVSEIPAKQSLPVIGFGGSFSDASALLYHGMSRELQHAFMQSYFSNDGLAYSLARVPIASSDFSCRQQEIHHPEGVPSLKACDPVLTQYSYADNDTGDLNTFSLQEEDIHYKIPMILEALKSLAASGNALTLYASPWSAPAWMKTNLSMVHGALLPEYQNAWAEYFIHFLNAYKQQGIDFWALTVQNEPVEEGFLGTKDLQTWQTMYSTWYEQADFIANALGPRLAQYNKTVKSAVHLIMHDDQITTIEKRVSGIMNTDAAEYIDGAGLHWYMNNLLPLSDDYPKLDKAYATLNQSTDKTRFILGTEACEGYLTGIPGHSGPSIGSWSRAEAYAHDIMSDLTHHVSGWTDWNLVLDMEGGPNWAHNYVDSPILVDIDKQTFYRQPMFFYLGHFAKFIRPGSIQRVSTSTGPAPIEEIVYDVPATTSLPAHRVITVLNRDFTSRHYLLEDKGIASEARYVKMTLPAHSIQTLVYRLTTH